MDQRISIMVAAILFAIVVAGSVAYLIYNNPSSSQPTVTPTASASPTTPSTFVFATAKPNPTILPLATHTPMPQVKPMQTAKAVSATAATGPYDWTIGLIVLMPIFGALALLQIARK